MTIDGKWNGVRFQINRPNQTKRSIGREMTIEETPYWWKCGVCGLGIQGQNRRILGSAVIHRRREQRRGERTSTACLPMDTQGHGWLPLEERPYADKSPGYRYYRRTAAEQAARYGERIRVYEQSPAGKARHRRNYLAMKEKYPEKASARSAVSNAVKLGELVPLPCEACGGPAQAHHDDYTKPLEVRWRCRDHHRELEGR